MSMATPSFLPANKTLIFSCSGGSDVGGVTDRVARKLTREGVGKMYCITGIGSHTTTVIDNTRLAERVLVLDGCAQRCAWKTLEQAGLTVTQALDLSSLGFVKGQTPETESVIESVADHARQALAAG